MKAAARRLLVACALLLFAASAAVTGCASDCGRAEDLCNDCENPGSNCERFRTASEEYCQQAIEDYEATCVDKF